MPVKGHPDWSDVLKHPVRTFNTVRHLHPVQIANRAVRRLHPGESLPEIAHGISLVLRPPVTPAEQPGDRMFDGRSFCFLNRRILWEGPDRWSPDGVDLLWTYNLHYFRFLWGLSPAAGRTLVADWIDENRGPKGAGWDAYPISLRVREWMDWLLAHPELDPAFRAAAVESIAQQTAVLYQRLEFHLMGNHLLENAITLCWAGLSLAGAPAPWLETGMRLLRQELARQILADGSHDERSPMYQALLAEALLRLAEVAGRSPNSSAAAEIRTSTEQAGQRMLRSLACLVHPDGHYALLNDAAFGVAPSLHALTERFGKPATPENHHVVWALPAAGYAGYRTPKAGYLVFDGGPIGPDHQPGHGHADTLSFELSHRGRRIVTDTGVLTYTSGAERTYDRSTAAHNTIEVDDRDQSELWGAFRCARRTAANGVFAEDAPKGPTFSGSYIGPGRRFGSVRHDRRVCVSESVLAFTDEVRASGDRYATLRLHFAPGLQLRRTAHRWIVADRLSHPVAAIAGDRLEWRESVSPYHPEFGRELERRTLEARVAFRGSLTLKWWLLLN